MPLGLSMHSPRPDTIIDGQRVPGDWLLDEDEGLRTAALAAAVASLKFAAEADIRRVVFHLGHLDLGSLYSKVAAGFNGGSESTPKHRANLDEYRNARDHECRKRRGWLVQAIDSIQMASNGVEVCVENRYRYDQVPGLGDALMLMERYPQGSGLSYWHDTGHEAAQRALGLWPIELPTEVADRIAGFHLHDCIGLDDHMPPGEGNYHFESLNHVARPGTPLVLELSPTASPARVQASRKELVRSLNSEGGWR